VSGVVVSVATAWSAVEDVEGYVRHAGRQPARATTPPTKIVHVLEETKEKHAQNNGRETLMNWHPCFISVTHLVASALGL